MRGIVRETACIRREEGRTRRGGSCTSVHWRGGSSDVDTRDRYLGSDERKVREQPLSALGRLGTSPSAFYSRSATSGSTRVALRAGPYDAAQPTARSNAPIAPYVAGSVGVTPNKSPLNARVASNAATVLTSSPDSDIRIPS